MTQKHEKHLWATRLMPTPFWYKNASSTKLSIWSLSWGQRQWDVRLALQVIWELKQLKVCIFKNTIARALGYLDVTALTWWHLLCSSKALTQRGATLHEWLQWAPKCSSSWELKSFVSALYPLESSRTGGLYDRLSCCTGSLTHTTCCFEQLIPS